MSIVNTLPEGAVGPVQLVHGFSSRYHTYVRLA